MGKIRRTLVSGETIRKIDKLHRKGLSSYEIADFVHASDSAVKSYIRIIDAAFGNGSFCLNPKVYNKKAVAEFCKFAGVMVPINTYERNTEQIEFHETKCEMEKPLIIDTPDERLICECRKALVNHLWAIYNNVYAIAKSLEIILKTNEEGNTNE